MEHVSSAAALIQIKRLSLSAAQGAQIERS
jgi:hypothetical protein